jgi:hypothetical protein
MGKTKSSPGTWVERDVFESNAFLSLKGFAPQLLILFLAKRQFRNHGRQGKQKKICINCNSLTFTYVEARKKYGVTKSRFTRARDELLAKGFLTVVYHGGGYKQDKNIYALSDKWMMWQPGMVFETRKKVKVQRGFCKPKTKVTLENVPIHSHENVPIREVLG